MGNRMMKVVPWPISVSKWIVLVHDHGMCDGQTLAGALAHALGGEERVKDPATRLFGNPGAHVANANTQPLFLWVEIVMVPLPLVASPTTSAMACAALTMRLRTTWLNSPGSHESPAMPGQTP
ncbi:MAG: hypothetical protein QOF48_1844 [Verrucomicrobiota bacterium]|jgi:hypothetical protein